MNKILVTGSNGFIGSHLVPFLKENKFAVTRFDIKDGHDIFSPEFESFVKHTDIVVHLAAKTVVDKSFKNPSEYFRVNTLGTARVLEMCQKYKRKLIYASSAAVFDPQSSPYAESKFHAENLVKLYQNILKVVILRFENIYGKGMQKGTLFYNFLHEPKLTVHEDGLQERDFINISDVVSIIKESFKDIWNSKEVEVGTSNNISVLEIAEIFNEITGKKIVFDKKKNGGVGESYADIEVLEKLYKKKMKTNLKEDIKKLCQN